MPTTDLASTAPWLESQRRSRARRFEAVRALRTCLAQSARHRFARRGLRAGVGVALASLTIATGGAMAAVHHHHHHATGGAAAVRAAGSTVADLQRALGIPADGVYGPQTRHAVRRFQRRHGLAVDGIAGPQTLRALGLHARTSSTGSSGGGAGVLDQIAQCESGGDPTAVSADGHYRGKYQFTRATWRAMGGKGDPARASEATQDRMAMRLYRARGLSPWPACSRGLR